MSHESILQIHLKLPLCDSLAGKCKSNEHVTHRCSLLLRDTGHQQISPMHGWDRWPSRVHTGVLQTYKKTWYKTLNGKRHFRHHHSVREVSNAQKSTQHIKCMRDRTRMAPRSWLLAQHTTASSRSCSCYDAVASNTQYIALRFPRSTQEVQQAHTSFDNNLIGVRLCILHFLHHPLLPGVHSSPRCWY